MQHRHPGMHLQSRAPTPTDLLGKVIQQGVKTFEAALVDGHPDAPELAVPTFVEGDPFGRWRCDHMGVVGIGRRDRCMFRWMLGVPQDGLGRMHALISQAPARQRQKHTEMIKRTHLSSFSICSLSSKSQVLIRMWNLGFGTSTYRST